MICARTRSSREEQGVGFLQFIPAILAAVGSARQAAAKQKQQQQAAAAPVTRVASQAVEEVDAPPKNRALPWVIGGGTLLLVGVAALIISQSRK